MGKMLSTPSCSSILSANVSVAVSNIFIDVPDVQYTVYDHPSILLH